MVLLIFLATIVLGIVGVSIFIGHEFGFVAGSVCLIVLVVIAVVVIPLGFAS